MIGRRGSSRSLPESREPMLFLSLFVVVIVGVIAGVGLAEIPKFSRRAVPFSGGLLLGIALFWVLPEIAGVSGWIAALSGAAAGFGALWAIDRFVYPVCPACSDNSLPHFAPPLLIAASIHAFFDGWSIATAQGLTGGGLKTALLL